MKERATKLLDFVPLRSADLDRCREMGSIFVGYLKAAIAKDFTEQLNHIFFAKEIPHIHTLWNPYTSDEVITLTAGKPEKHKQVLVDWYNLKHDLLEASFKAAWHLTKLGQDEIAKEVLTLGVTLSDGSDRLVLEKLNKANL